MKTKYLILVIIFSQSVLSFKNPNNAPVKSFSLFYVDNSYSKTYENFGQEMFGIVEAKVDSIGEDRFSSIGFFLANGDRTEFASNYKGAKSIISKLSNGSTNAPNSFYDRSYIMESLLTTDWSSIKSVNINIFLSEASLLSDFFRGNSAGIFINSLPREIQFLVSCSEENIKVIIYYPSGSKKVSLNTLKPFVDFSVVHKDFASKTKFEFIPI